MKKTVLIATNNQGKIDEFRGILKDLNIKLVSLNDIKFTGEEPSETGENFSANAVIKAKYYGSKTKLPTMADDSGLLVNVLSNKLGLKTRRYAGGTDKDRYLKLLKEMENVPASKREARFISAVAFYNPKTNTVKTAIGVCEGKIAFQPKGTHGFGYDPVFIVKKLNKHFAQLTLEEKNQVSHRAKALKKIKSKINLS